MNGPGQIAAVLAGAAFVGAGIGLASLPGAGARASQAGTDLRDMIDGRSRPPQAGDRWGGCNDARAAGTAPIYSDEPGYRADMDGDGDGIACEPHA